MLKLQSFYSEDNHPKTRKSQYRATKLSTHFCKIMKRRINNGLTRFLENNDRITDLKCGFRNKRSTIDHLDHVETFRRKSFFKKWTLDNILFFFLNRAYNTAWKYGILRDLNDLGLRGRLPKFIISCRRETIKFVEDLSFPTFRNMTKTFFKEA